MKSLSPDIIHIEQWALFNHKRCYANNEKTTSQLCSQIAHMNTQGVQNIHKIIWKIFSLPIFSVAETTID